jgi:hypothetical protein
MLTVGKCEMCNMWDREGEGKFCKYNSYFEEKY